MAEQQPRQPEDYVKSRNQVDLDEQVGRTISALERPTSILLFVVIIVMVISAADYLSVRSRSHMMSNFLGEVESNRSSELERCAETLQQMISVCGHTTLSQAGSIFPESTDMIGVTD